MREQQKIRIAGHHSRGILRKKSYGMKFGAVPTGLLLTLFHGNAMEADDARNKIFALLYGITPSRRISPRRFYVTIDPADEKRWLRYSEKSTTKKPSKKLIRLFQPTSV